MAIYYVDPTYGLDTNDGLTPQAPLRKSPTYPSSGNEYRYLKLAEAQIVGQATWRNSRNKYLSYPTSGAATNPFQLTKSSHGLTTGDWIFNTRAGTKEIMGLHQVTVIDNNNFTIPVDGTATSWTSYTGMYMNKVNACVVTFPIEFRNYTKPIAICGTGTHPTHGLSQTHLSNTIAPWTNGTATAAFRYSTSNYDMQYCAPDYLEVTVTSSQSGKLCYLPFEGPLDLSSFKGITFWSRLRSGSNTQSGMYIALCSDSAGDVPVHTTPIIKDCALDIWAPQFHDFGTFLDSNINSIAIYKDATTTSTNYWNFQGFLACKGLDTPEQCINYTTIISPKRAPDDTSHQIHTIIGENVLIDDNSYLDSHTHNSSADQWQGYNYLGHRFEGTTIEESLDTWLIHPHRYSEQYNTTLYNANSSSHYIIASATNNTTFSGGWEIDESGNAVQPEGSLTWMMGAGSGTFYYKQSYNDQVLENFGVAYYYRGFYDYYGSNFIVRNCTFSHVYQAGYTYRPSGTQLFNCNINNNYSWLEVYYLADSAQFVGCNFTNLNYSIEIDQGVGTLIDKCSFKNVYNCINEYRSGGVIVENTTAKNLTSFFRIQHDYWGGSSTIRKLTLDNYYYVVDSTQPSRNGHVFIEDFTSLNPKINSTVPIDNLNFSKTNFPGGTAGYSDNILAVNSNYQNNFQVTTPSYIMKSDYDVYNTSAPSIAIYCSLDGKPSAWSSFPQEIVDQYVVRNDIVIASIALDSAASTTISCFLRKTSSYLNARIGIMGYHVGAGEVFSDDITSNNTWEQVSITFTPTKKGVVELYASIDSGALQSSTYLVHVDDIQVTLN